MIGVDRAIREGKPCSCGMPFETCPVWSKGLPALGPRAQRNASRIRAADLERLRLAIGRPLLLDLSKTRAWRLTRWWWRRREGYLILVRDSRGVLPRHRKWMQRWDRFAAKHASRCHVLHYEDLALDPHGELAKVLEFLGLPPHEGLEQHRRNVQHFMLSSKTGALDLSNEVRLDERWKEELTAAEQAAIVDVMRSVPLLAKRYVPD